GVEPALESLVERLRELHALDIALDIQVAQDPDFTRLAPETESALYRLVQEALTNVVKHADARMARVTVIEEGETLRVSVSDDGRLRLPGLVSFRFQLHPEEPQALRSRGANVRRVLAHAACEDERVETIHRRGHRRHARSQAVRVDAEREARVGVSLTRARGDG